jgi:hypothetical protein
MAVEANGWSCAVTAFCASVKIFCASALALVRFASSERTIPCCCDVAPLVVVVREVVSAVKACICRAAMLSSALASDSFCPASTAAGSAFAA